MSNLQFKPYCPTDGAIFYVCGNYTGNFIGCCTSNPCSSANGCPSGNLKPASFDAAYYGDFHDQECSAGLFYTCNNTKPPFLGCCKSNPCSQGCPSDSLAAVFLSGNPVDAADFLPPSGSSSSTASTSPSTSTASTNISSQIPASHSSGLSAGAIPGIVIGGVGGIAIIAGFILLCRRVSRLREIRESPQKEEQSLSHSQGAGKIYSPDPVSGGAMKGSPMTPSSQGMSTSSAPFNIFFL